MGKRWPEDMPVPNSGGIEATISGYSSPHNNPFSTISLQNYKKYFKEILLANNAYRLMRGQWRNGRVQSPRPGYTLLLPVPHDLPVFLHLAGAVCSRQHPEGLVETLVIPDRVHSGFQQQFERFAAEWPLGPVRLVELRPIDRAIRARTRNTSVMHWLQIINACETVSSTHAFLHDADTFLLNRDFLRERYRRCIEDDVSFLGVQQRWDMAQGADVAVPRSYPNQVIFPELTHLLATWELVFDVSCLRSFRPNELRAQYVVLRGLFKHLDTLHMAQLQIGPERVACQPADRDFVHLSGVISNYLSFGWSRGPFHDRGFKLLMLRLMIDAFDPDTPGYNLPTVDEMAEGIGRSDRRVTYSPDEGSLAAFSSLRDGVKRIASSQSFDGRSVSVIEEGLDRFGRRYEAAAS